MGNSTSELYCQPLLATSSINYPLTSSSKVPVSIKSLKRAKTAWQEKVLKASEVQYVLSQVVNTCPMSSIQYLVDPVPVNYLPGSAQALRHLCPSDPCWRHFTESLWVLLEHLLHQLYVIAYVRVADKFAACPFFSFSTLLQMLCLMG